MFIKIICECCILSENNVHKPAEIRTNNNVHFLLYVTINVVKPHMTKVTSVRRLGVKQILQLNFYYCYQYSCSCSIYSYR